MYAQFFVLFALLFTGYALCKAKILSDTVNNGLSRLTIYAAFPCIIVSKIGTLEMDGHLLGQFFLCILISFLLFFAYALYSRLYGKLRHFPKNLDGVAEILMSAPNNAFMGFPIANLFLGQMGLFMMVANNVAMVLLVFSYCSYRLAGKGKSQGLAKGFLEPIIKIFLNPNIIATAIGLALCIKKIVLPEFFSSYLEQMGNLCTPLSMIYIGAGLVGTNLLDIIKNRVVLEIGIHKLLVFPLVTLFLLYFTPLPPMLIATCVLAGALPTAAVAAILVEEKGRDGKFASQVLFFTTAVSMATLLPIIRLIFIFVL